MGRKADLKRWSNPEQPVSPNPRTRTYWITALKLIDGLQKP
jgi:hypothetical protein